MSLSSIFCNRNPIRFVWFYIIGWARKAREYISDRFFIFELRRRGRDAFFLVAAPPPHLPRIGRDRQAGAFVATLERDSNLPRRRGRTGFVRRHLDDASAEAREAPDSTYGFYLLPDRHIYWLRSFGLGLACTYILLSLLHAEGNLSDNAVLYSPKFLWGTVLVLGVSLAVQITVWHRAFQPISYDSKILRVWELACGLSAVAITFSPLWILAVWQFDLLYNTKEATALSSKSIEGVPVITEPNLLNTPFFFGFLFWLAAGIILPIIVFAFSRRALLTNVFDAPIMPSNHWGYLAESFYRRHKRGRNLYYSFFIDLFYRKQRVFNQIACFGPRYNRETSLRERAMMDLFLDQVRPSMDSNLIGYRLSMLRYTLYFLTPLWTSLLCIVVIIVIAPSFQTQSFTILCWVLLSVRFIQKEASRFLSEWEMFARDGLSGAVKDGNSSLLPPFALSLEQRRALLRFVLSQEADHVTINLPTRIVSIAGVLLGALASAG